MKTDFTKTRLINEPTHRDEPPTPTSSPYAELLVRWFQFGAFCPLYRVHGDNSSTELWNYGDATMATINATTTLRYRLLPYIYSLAKLVDAPPLSSSSSSSSFSGGHYTMQRALAFDFGASDPSVHDLALNGNNGGVGWPDEFTFGPALLVAPMLWPASETALATAATVGNKKKEQEEGEGKKKGGAALATRDIYLPIAAMTTTKTRSSTSSSSSSGSSSVGGGQRSSGSNDTGVFYDFWTGESYAGIATGVHFERGRGKIGRTS